MERYWEKEEPVEVVSAKNKLRWFPKAGRLQVALPDWEGAEGRTMPGKTVTLDVEALAESDDAAKALKILAAVMDIVKGVAGLG